MYSMCCIQWKNFISNEKDIEDKLAEQVTNLIKTNNISDENVIKIAEAIDSRDQEQERWKMILMIMYLVNKKMLIF